MEDLMEDTPIADPTSETHAAEEPWDATRPDAGQDPDQRPPFGFTTEKYANQMISFGQSSVLMGQGLIRTAQSRVHTTRPGEVRAGRQAKHGERMIAYGQQMMRYGQKLLKAAQSENLGNSG